MSRRQDYIARIRYQNTLPPPPCSPRLLRRDVDVSGLLKAGGLSTATLARDCLTDVDMELGMPLDLTQVPHAFDDPSALLSEDDVEIDAEDRDLLVEPTATGQTARPSSGGPGVSFLRRTEYISSEAVRSERAALAAKYHAAQDPDEQLQRIEASFDLAQVPLAELKHPKKKNVHAVKAWPLFPDTKQLDLTYLAVRMTGSASLHKMKRKITADQLKTTLFVNSSLGGPDEEGEEWMGFFADENLEEVAVLKKKLADTRDIAPDEGEYRFVRMQDNDIEFVPYKHEFEEVAISLSKDASYYVPIAGRTNLKRRRVAPLRAQAIEDANTDIVELTLRDVNASESIERDGARSRYDPVSYSGA